MKRKGMLTCEAISESVAECLLKAGTRFRKDQFEAYRRAIETEKNENARWVLERILENATIAREKRYPLCDDTGIPHLFLEIGDKTMLPAGWLSAVHLGVKRGLKAMPGRPMAVRGTVVERVEQSRGLFSDPGKVLPAPVIVKPTRGKRLKITVLLLGGGPEIRAKTHRIFHKRNMDGLLKEAADWAGAEMNRLGCTPCTLAVGIGRSHAESSALMLEAMKEGRLDRQNPWEKKLTAWLNETKVGPLGLGGGTTALGAFLKVGPLRASGVRIVTVRPCCCVEPRRATVALGNNQ
jgi:fumarate hydratase subunit alpha